MESQLVIRRFPNRSEGLTPVTPALFKGQLYFLLITISSFHCFGNLCCVPCGSMFLFPSFASSLVFLLLRCFEVFPVPFLCIRCVLCRGDAYDNVQLLTTSTVLIKLLILTFKEALKIGILIVNQYLYQLGYFTLQFTEKPAPKLLEEWRIYFLTNWRSQVNVSDLRVVKFVRVVKGFAVSPRIQVFKNNFF